MDQICQLGEECFHEAMVFAVGETAAGHVEIALLRPDGRLTALVVGNFTSWRKQDPRAGACPPDLVDCISRAEHGTVIHLFGQDLAFYGAGVRLTAVDIGTSEHPRTFGPEVARRNRDRCLAAFNTPEARETIRRALSICERT